MIDIYIWEFILLLFTCLHKCKQVAYALLCLCIIEKTQTEGGDYIICRIVKSILGIYKNNEIVFS